VKTNAGMLALMIVASRTSTIARAAPRQGEVMWGNLPGKTMLRALVPMVLFHDASSLNAV
jgi:hypothetical protein